MNQDLCDFLFSKEERTILPSSIAILALAFVAMGIATVSFSALSYETFGIFTGIILLLSIYLLIEHIRNRDIRMARFFLSHTSVSLQYGNTAIVFEANDEYQVSILRLYQPLGKGYTFKPYIVLWNGSAPMEEVHPFTLIKKGRIVLPLTEATLAKVKQFVCYPEIPAYPNILHHSGRRIHITSTLQ